MYRLKPGMRINVTCIPGFHLLSFQMIENQLFQKKSVRHEAPILLVDESSIGKALTQRIPYRVLSPCR